MPCAPWGPAGPCGPGSPFGPGSSPFGESTGSNSNLGNSGTVTGAGLTGNTGAGLTTSGLGNTGATTGASTPAQSQSKSALGPIERTSQCISLGPSGGGCDTGNLAVPIGLAALALLATLFTWDYLRQRRRTQLTGGTEVPQ